jgi:hypothetical protein
MYGERKLDVSGLNMATPIGVQIHDLSVCPKSSHGVRAGLVTSVNIHVTPVSGS